MVPRGSKKSLVAARRNLPKKHRHLHIEEKLKFKTLKTTVMLFLEASQRTKISAEKLTRKALEQKDLNHPQDPF